MPAEAAALSACPEVCLGCAWLCIKPLTWSKQLVYYTDWPLGFTSRAGREKLILFRQHKQQRTTACGRMTACLFSYPLPTPLPTLACKRRSRNQISVPVGYSGKVLIWYEVNFIAVMSSGGGARLTRLVQTRAQCIGHPDTSVRVFTNWSGVPFQRGTVLGKYEFLNTSVLVL